MDDELQAAASDVAGFAGVYVDEGGRVVVRTTQPTDAVTAEDVRGIDLRLAIQVAEAGLRVLPADYTFAELNGWKDALRLAVTGMTGFVSLDLNERTNRLDIGVEDPSATAVAQVHATAQKAGVPITAVAVVRDEPVPQDATLRNKQRPLRGGLQIWGENSGGGGGDFLCSLGLPVLRAAEVVGADPSDPIHKYLLTNSHCTSIQGGTELTRLHQHEPLSVTNYVGVEFADPKYSGSVSGCPDQKLCRHSDSALYRVQDYFGLTPPSAKVGEIAPTQTSSQAGGRVSDYTIASGTIKMKEINTTIAMGAEVHKIGRTTGHTYGDVIKTCYDSAVANSSIHLFCQYRADYESHFGDSGALVWMQYTNYILGLHWGGGNQPYGVFSPIGGVQRDLGDLIMEPPT